MIEFSFIHHCENTADLKKKTLISYRNIAESKSIFHFRLYTVQVGQVVEELLIRTAQTFTYTIEQSLEEERGPANYTCYPIGRLKNHFLD